MSNCAMCGESWPCATPGGQHMSTGELRARVTAAETQDYAEQMVGEFEPGDSGCLPTIRAAIPALEALLAERDSLRGALKAVNAHFNAENKALHPLARQARAALAKGES